MQSTALFIPILLLTRDFSPHQNNYVFPFVPSILIMSNAQPSLVLGSTAVQLTPRPPRKNAETTKPATKPLIPEDLNSHEINRHAVQWT